MKHDERKSKGTAKGQIRNVSVQQKWYGYLKMLGRTVLATGLSR